MRRQPESRSCRTMNHLRFSGRTAAEQREAASQLSALMSEGRLPALVGAEFSLPHAAAAHRLQEDNTLHGAGTLSGKIVLTP